MKAIQKNWFSILMILIPLGYALMVYGDLPAEVPIHWNSEGEPDKFGGKNWIFLGPVILCGFVYLLLSGIPAIDPDKKIDPTDGKWIQFKSILMLFMAGLSMIIIYNTIHPDQTMITKILIWCSLLFAGLGNYFQTLKQNYFIGLRTPWTLANEQVWNKTHRLSGKVWMVIGLLMTIILFLLGDSSNAMPIFLGGIAILIILPFIHSYRLFKQLETENS